MNGTLKTVLLTILTLSLFTIALIELSGVSKTALFNKFGAEANAQTHSEASPLVADNHPKTTIEFESSSHDFGVISEGEIVQHVFKFTNTGSNPLFIKDVIASCGCTVPSFPKNPIAPGKTGEITVEFNSKGRPGTANKNVLVVSNAQEERISLNFKAEVKP